MKKIYLVGFFLFTFNFLLNAQTVVLNAVKDNTIYSDNTTNSNGAGPNFTTGAIQNNPSRRALIMFDLSSIPAGATITAASLRMVMNKTNSGASNVAVHRLNASWGEAGSNAGNGGDGDGAGAQNGDATWNCSFSNGGAGCTSAWATAGGAYQATASATVSVNGNGAYTWSGAQMVANVQAWKNNAATNFGWIIIGAEGIPGSAKRFASRTNATVANRPTLTVTYNMTVPINLLYFNAQAQSAGTKLSWKTAQEVNNDYFEIEFSTDGLSFTPVGRVPGAGTSSVPTSYSFTHQTIYAGKVFYRLSQTDFNGGKSYSQVEPVDIKSAGTSLIIFPNPVTTKITLPGVVTDGKQRYAIINLQGKAIAEGALLTREIRLPSNVAPGMYMLRVLSNNGSVQSSAFMKY